MLHIPPTNSLLLTAKQEPYKKAYLLTKNIEEFSGKKFRRKGQQAENDKTERVTGLGRRTREEIAKWNQMTALRFQTGGRHQTSPASLRGWERRRPCIPGYLWRGGASDSALLSLTIFQRNCWLWTSGCQDPC